MNKSIHYSDAENKFFIEFIPGHTDKETAMEFKKRFGREITKSMIGNRKTALKVHNGLIGGRFEKGQVAFNKGKPQSEYMSAEGIAKCRKTQFAKGHIPANARPIGSERLTKDGYIMIKKSTRNESNKNFFDLKHKIIWEAAHGKIPKNHCLVFLDGDKTNCNLDNLKLVHRAQLARLNQNHLLSKDTGSNTSAILVSKIMNESFKKRKIIQKGVKE